MSLRTRTLLLFLIFVLVPMVAVGVAFSVVSERALKDAARRGLDAGAGSMAAEVEGELASTRSRLQRIAEQVETASSGGASPGRRAPEDVVRHGLLDDPVLAASLSSLRLSVEGGISASMLKPPSGNAEVDWICGDGGSVPSTEVRARTELEDGRAVEMIGTIPVAAIFSRESAGSGSADEPITVVIDRRSGRIVQLAPCADTLALPATLTGTLGDPGDTDRATTANPGQMVPGTELLESDETLASVVHLEEPAWTIGRAASAGAILAPLRRFRLISATFVFLVAVVALLTFRMMSRRFFRSLEELHDAVQRIGTGDFDFWLPPPGKNEVGWLSSALGRMAERITHLVRGAEKRGSLALMGEMSAHVAHEIRTPLSSIKLNLQRLRRGTEADGGGGAQKAKIECCLSEIDRLETTVLSVLDVGAERQLSPRPCSFHTLIADTVSLVEGMIDESGVSVRLDLRAESDRVRVDPGRVKGVLLNLIMNALDATSAGGEIAIRTQLFLDGDGRQMFGATVRDTGPGVPEELRRRIFDPFFTTKEEGGGMGLSFALKTMQDHGGDLFLSEPVDADFGASFVVVVPLFLDERVEDDPTRLAASRKASIRDSTEETAGRAGGRRQSRSPWVARVRERISSGSQGPPRAGGPVDRLRKVDG